MLGKNSKIFFTVSIGFLIVAIVLASWGFQKIVDKQIQKNLQLENNSMTFDKWLKIPMPLGFKVYVFNVTNPDDVNRGDKPLLQEIGPYVYKQYRERRILSYGANDTVKYMLNKRFEFDAEASGGLTEEDEVVVVYFPYLAAILKVFDMMPSLAPAINKALEQFFPNLEDAFMRVKVKDLFFDGVYLSCDGDNAALGLVCGQIKAMTPPTMRKADTNGFYFSMFSHMNRSESGPYEMIRGRENIKDLGRIVSYQGKETMSMWGDQYCGMINGTDSTIFPPIDPNNIPQRLYTFEPDVCRSVYAEYVGKRDKFNISAYYYEITESAFAAKSANKENKCFCKKNWSGNHDGCLLMGLMNLLPCQDAPAIVSLPHFYLASEELLEYFKDGSIKPDKEKHNTFAYLDPTTGVPLEGLKRLQFNIELRRMENIPQLKNVRTGLFPLLWVEEGASIPANLQEELLASHKLLSYVEVAKWLLLAIAVIMTVIAAVNVAKATHIVPWPRNRNSVSFILGPSVNNVNKQ